MNVLLNLFSCPIASKKYHCDYIYEMKIVKYTADFAMVVTLSGTGEGQCQ